MIRYSMDARVYRVTSTREWGGVSRATYRSSYTYFQASQVYGLLLKVLTIKHHAPRLSRASTLEIIDMVMESKDHIHHVSPMLPYIEHLWISHTGYLDGLRRSYRESAIDIATSSLNVLQAAIEVPKALLRDLAGSNGSSGISRYYPLAVAPFIYDLLRAGSTHGGHGGGEPRLRRRFRSGIAVDRLRKTARYGLFFAYQYSVVSAERFVSSFGCGREIDDMHDLARVMGLGYKKSISNPIAELSILRNPRQTNVEEYLDSAAKLALKIVREASPAMNDLARVMIYAYDSTYLPVGAIRHACSEAKVIDLWLDRSNKIYLSLTNKFYTINQPNGAELVSSGSYIILEAPTQCVDKLVGEFRRFNPGSIDIAPEIVGGGKAGEYIRSLIIDKLSKAFRNYVFIPYQPMGTGVGSG